MEQKPKHATAFRRFASVFAAGVCLVLAVAGAMLPGLPTTPFVLLASYLLMRSSPTLHARLQNSRWFGNLLRDWERHRSISRRTKIRAIFVVIVCVMFTMTRQHLPSSLKILILGFTGIGIVVICRIPVIVDEGEPAENKTDGSKSSSHRGADQ